MVHNLGCCVLLVSSYLRLFYFIHFLKINYSIEEGILCIIVFRDCIITWLSGTLCMNHSRQKNKILAVTKMFYLIVKYCHSEAIALNQQLQYRSYSPSPATTG